MKLLIVTQKVDENDGVLGFMHGWIREFSLSCEKVSVICLEKGEYHLPENVKVLSLGKERITDERGLRHGWTRIKYSWNLLRYIVRIRKDYDSVFVHMNEEYVLLGGIIWKILGKMVYMWRNHYSGSWKTRLAGFMCDKVFCTSKSSYTAKFKNAVLMPVGVDTELFKPVADIKREPRSIIFYGRMSQSKRPDILLKALAELVRKGIGFIAKLFGNPPEREQKFYEDLKKSALDFGLSSRVGFLRSVPHIDGSKIFSAHEIFVNLSPAGMYDKTLFEASGCGCLVLSTSPDFAELVKDNRFFVTDLNPEAVAQKLEKILNFPESEKGELSKKFQQIALAQSLQNLSQKLFKEISGGL